MAASKTAKTLLASQSLAASTSINSTEWNLTSAYGGLIGIKLNNGSSAPTTAPNIRIFVGETTGVKRLFYSITGDTVNSSIKDVVCQIPPECMFCNVTIDNGATNSITVEVYGQELTGI